MSHNIKERSKREKKKTITEKEKASKEENSFQMHKQGLSVLVKTEKKQVASLTN